MNENLHSRAGNRSRWDLEQAFSAEHVYFWHLSLLEICGVSFEKRRERFFFSLEKPFSGPTGAKARRRSRDAAETQR